MTSSLNLYGILFICIFSYFSLQGQTYFGTRCEKYIEISIAISPHKVKLIKVNDDIYTGTLTTTLWYEKLKEVKDVDISHITIIDEIDIEATLVKELISKIEKAGIENIRDCNVLENCMTFLDGGYTEFKIGSSGQEKSLYFDTLTPNTNQDYLENISENRKLAQEIINILDNEFDFEKDLNETFLRLPDGKYSYWMGNGTVEITIGKK